MWDGKWSEVVMGVSLVLYNEGGSTIVMGMARRSVWVQWRQSAILLEVVWGDRVNVDNGRGQSDMWG